MMGCGGGSISTEDDGSDGTTEVAGSGAGNDGEGVTVENTFVCAAIEGNYECLENCPNNLATATVTSDGSTFSILLPSAHSEEDMVGSCPDFTITMGSSETYVGTITFDNDNLFTLDFTPDYPGASGEAVFARASEDDEDAEDDEDNPDAADTSIDGSILVGTFVPASDNTFNASLLNKDIVIADACDPTCSLTYGSQVYNNCTGTFVNTTLTMQCDVLGTLNTTVAVSGDDVTLRLDNINIVDGNGSVTATQTFSYIKQ
ncbi:MAG: hypothetical protein HY465_01535 [Deltaproteobacteria bacterium]|nr:hypothetical protein [Deltaproteobacteria bacterium]